jgi:hypothetical protein
MGFDIFLESYTGLKDEKYIIFSRTARATMDLVVDLSAPCTAPAAEAARLWSAARVSIRDKATATPEQTARTLAFLRRWRLRAARARPEALTCAFVATCAVRMAALDACADQAAARELARPAARLEADSFVEFQPPKSQEEALRAVRAAARRWDDEEFCGWNVVAYAASFVLDDSADTVVVNEPFLLECARFDAECVLRAELREQHLAAATVVPPDARAPAALAWALRKTRNANDDLFALGREAIVWTFLTPAAERRGEGVPSHKLSCWDPDRGAEAFAASTALNGFAALRGPCPHATSALFLFLFDYIMRQLLDVRFLALFFVSDLNGDTALRRIEDFRVLKLQNPPPLVVHSMRTWHVVRRGTVGALGAVTAHAGSVDALLAWMDCVMTQRRGVLFLGKSLQALFKEATTAEEERSDVLVATTEAL